MLPRFLHPVLLLLGSTLTAFAGSSNSLLDVTPNGKHLIAANTDNGSVSIVDLKEKKLLKEIPVGDHPEGVSWVGEGPLAIVTVYRDDLIAFVDTQTRKVEKIKCSAEPYGVVVTKDGKKAYVSHDYPGLVSEIDIPAKKVVRTFSAGEWTRGIALNSDETKLYVTNNFTTTLSEIDLKQGRVVDSWLGRESDNLCRNVVLHPKRPKAYLTHLRSRVHVFDARGSIFPEISIVTLVPADKETKRRTALSMDTFNGVYVVANPWESALSPDGKSFVTVYAGTDDMNYSTTVDDDYSEIKRGGVISVGKHPRAVRFSPDGSELYVYATMDFSLNVIPWKGTAPAGRSSSIKLCDPPHTPEWVQGKILFSTSRGPLTNARWISCSSCHPDGSHDGRVWQNPEGHRKTPPMFGLAHTHPLHFSADRDEVQDFEYTIRGKLMGGRGLASGSNLKPKIGFHPIELEQKTSGLSKDLDALAIYTNSFQPKLSPHIPAKGKLSPEAERGKKLFFDTTVGCATCHSGPYYTDSSLKKPFKLHDVGTGDGPDEKMGPKYDTPTLLGVYRSAPYLHHGKAKTLMEVLTTYNPKDKHGKTSHLKKEELEDLVAFLKSLPYDTPPDETENTVPFRVKLKHPTEDTKTEGK
jgi:YVTN family beta-propeller protein